MLKKRKGYTIACCSVACVAKTTKVYHNFAPCKHLHRTEVCSHISDSILSAGTFLEVRVVISLYLLRFSFLLFRKVNSVIYEDDYKVFLDVSTCFTSTNLQL